ncbi:MAG: response regulator [Burkholderiaceae bacterium]
MRILYVEDQDYLRETIGLLLEEPDREIVSVDSAESALLALQASRENRFDLLITDVSLPGVSGIELARRARQQLPRLWVVLMSGYTFADQLGEFGERCAALSKPFDAEQLDALIERIRTELEA